MNPDPQTVAINNAKALYKRRSVLATALTPEVRAAMREVLGIQGMLFAFEEDTDPLKACRRDTMRGVIEVLEFEADHAEESRQIYQTIINHLNTQQQQWTQNQQ